MNGLISLSLKLFLLMFFLTLSCFTLAHAKSESKADDMTSEYSYNRPLSDRPFSSSLFLPT